MVDIIHADGCGIGVSGRSSRNWVCVPRLTGCWTGPLATCSSASWPTNWSGTFTVVFGPAARR